jgi:ribonuclease E
MGDPQGPASDAVLESHTHQDARRPEADGEDRRERRSRDRYGRDRRERGERQPREEDAAVASGDAPVMTAGEGTQEERTPRYPTGFVTEAQETPLQAPANPIGQARVETPHPAPAAQAVAPARHLPKVEPFELPVAQLAQVAEGSGLQWVNSDAQKIAAVQAAIAAEPAPPRVPRERPPAIVIDEGPLVLVETRRDLSEMKLPFEQGQLPLQ